MTLHYVNNETGDNYKYEVLHIVFNEGTLYCLVKDNDRQFMLQYNAYSLDTGMISIY